MCGLDEMQKGIKNTWIKSRKLKYNTPSYIDDTFQQQIHWIDERKEEGRLSRTKEDVAGEMEEFMMEEMEEIEEMEEEEEETLEMLLMHGKLSKEARKEVTGFMDSFGRQS